MTLTGSVVSYTLSGLGVRTRPVGQYTLTLNAAGSGIADLAGNALAEDASDTWTRRNRAPVALNDGYTTDEDTPLSVPAPGALGNDSDLDNHTLSAALAVAPAGVTLSADGSFSFVPPANRTGSFSWAYIYDDGKGAVDSCTVTIRVVP